MNKEKLKTDFEREIECATNHDALCFCGFADKPTDYLAGILVGAKNMGFSFAEREKLAADIRAEQGRLREENHDGLLAEEYPGGSTYDIFKAHRDFLD